MEILENLVCSARVLAQDPGSIMHTRLLNSQEENGGRHAKNRTIRVGIPSENLVCVQPCAANCERSNKTRPQTAPHAGDPYVCEHKRKKFKWQDKTVYGLEGSVPNAQLNAPSWRFGNEIHVHMCCYGLSLVSPKFICWRPNPQEFRMWLYLEMGSLKRRLS